MAEINLVAAFSTVPGGEADAIKQLLTDTIQQIAQDAARSRRRRSSSPNQTSAAGLPLSWTGSGRRACRFRLTSSSWRTPRPPPVPERS
jgi:hypothetical protein